MKKDEKFVSFNVRLLMGQAKNQELQNERLAQMIKQEKEIHELTVKEIKKRLGQS